MQNLISVSEGGIYIVRDHNDRDPRFLIQPLYKLIHFGGHFRIEPRNRLIEKQNF